MFGHFSTLWNKGVIENWRKKLNNDERATLMDLSKVFDTINHNLLIAKLHGYGFYNYTEAVFERCSVKRCS